MNYTEHYHDWLRDAHAMEKQAESMLESMASRIENYPDIKARIEQHISETKHQITMPTIEAILKEEMQMADWLIKHIPQTTEQFLLRSEADGVEAKK